MTLPTWQQIKTWEQALARLLTVADAANRLADAIADSPGNLAKTMHDAIYNLEWAGHAKTAAEGRADRERTDLGGLAVAYRDLATAVSGGSHDLAADTANIQAVLAAAGSGVTLAENDPGWTVTGTPAHGTAEQLHADLIRFAQSYLDHNNQWGPRIAAANGELQRMAPIAAALNADQADQLVADAKSGHLTAEDLAELQALRLTPDQLTALSNGDRVDIGQGKFDFLREMMGKMNGMSAQDIANLGATVPADQQQAVKDGLADAFRIISDPQVHAADAQGGMSQLPTAIDTLLTENPIATRRTMTETDTVIPRFDDFRAFTDLMGNGNKSIAGSDVDRGLVKQAAEPAATEADPHYAVVYKPGDYNHDDPYAVPGKPLGQGDVNGLACDMLQRAAGDHIAVHDALVGSPSMAVTCPHGNYNPTDHIGDLLNHDWRDENGHNHDQGIATLVGSIGDNATASNPFQNRQAGESADALASYLGGHGSDLLHITTADGVAEPGQANPELVGALGHTLAHYIPNMVGVNENILRSTGFGDLPSDSVKNIFAVIDSNKDAAVAFNQSAYAGIAQLDYQYGYGGCQDSSFGEFASRIDWAAQHGMNDELAVRVDDANQRHQSASDFYDLIANAAAGAAVVVPEIGPLAAPTILGVEPDLKTLLLTVPSLQDQSDISGSGDAATQNYNILRGLADSPHHAQLLSNPAIQQYLEPNGQPKPFDQLGEKDSRQVDPAFNSTMDRTVGDSLTQYQTAWTRGQDPRASGWSR